MLSWYILPLDISRSFPLNAFEQLWSACRIAQSHRSVDSSRSAAQWGHFPSVAPSNPLPGQGRVGGSWQPWRRSLLFRDCLNVLKGNQTKVCKSLQIGSKEVLKTIGMHCKHMEKRTHAQLFNHVLIPMAESSWWARLCPIHAHNPWSQVGFDVSPIRLHSTNWAQGCHVPRHGWWRPAKGWQLRRVSENSTHQWELTQADVTHFVGERWQITIQSRISSRLKSEWASLWGRQGDKEGRWDSKKH